MNELRQQPAEEWMPIETAPVEEDIIIGAYHAYPDDYNESKWVWQLQGNFGEGEPKNEFHLAFTDDVVNLPNYVCWQQPTHWRHVDKTPPYNAQKDVKISGLTKVVEAEQTHINALKSWIKEEGLRSNVCTKNILGKICENCQCGKAAYRIN